MKIKMKIILSLLVLCVLVSAAIFAVSCRTPIDEEDMPRARFGGVEWIESFPGNPGGYSVSNSAFTINSVPVGWKTYLSNSIYRTIEGMEWTVTFKLTPRFSAQHQNTGIVIGAPDGSAVGNLCGWTNEWNSSDGHLGVWFARGNAVA
jgi:hypothetical protein